MRRNSITIFHLRFHPLRHGDRIFMGRLGFLQWVAFIGGVERAITLKLHVPGDETLPAPWTCHEVSTR